jgi:hypothetical protein
MIHYSKVGTLQLNMAYKPECVEKSHIEKLPTLNQQLGRILLVLVVPYVQFIATTLVKVRFGIN